jgi:hypothetical protein
LAAVGAVVLAAAFTYSVWEAPIRIPLPPKDNLRILKVSLGTNHVFSLEPMWKRALRSVLPGRLENRLGADPAWRMATRESTLFLWVDEADAAGARHSSSFDQPVALLENGLAAPAESREFPERIVRLKFQSFARDQQEVPLQIRRGTNTIRFTVHNPQPSKRSSWKAESLPQTNLIKDTQVVFGPLRLSRSPPARSAVPEYEASIRTRANPATQWFSWRVTTVDDLGNWASTDYQHSSVVRIPMLPRTDSIWRVTVEGLEYVSAGFLEPLAATSVVVLQPHARSGTYGVQTVLHFGPGQYGITNGLVTGRPGARTFTNVIDLLGFDTREGTNWSAAFGTTVPAVLCISDLGLTDATPRLRVRERVPGTGGQIIGARQQRSITNVMSGRMRVATLWAPQVPRVATNHEVEIIGTLPPVNFSFSPR